jgi:hypothetical protein
LSYTIAQCSKGYYLKYKGPPHCGTENLIGNAQLIGLGKKLDVFFNDKQFIVIQICAIMFELLCLVICDAN